MAKQKSIYEKELAKAVHAFNEKVRYHQAKGEKHLPERQSVRELKKVLDTKKDFVKAITDFRSFGKKGAEAAVKVSEKLIITQWEKRKVEQEKATVNRSRAARKANVDKLDVTNQGQKTGYKRGEMSTNRTAQYAPKKLNWKNIRSRSELEALKNTLEAQTKSNYWKKRDEQWRQNYIKSLKSVYGNKANGVIDKIRGMPLKDFVKISNSDQNATVGFNYDPIDEDMKLAVLELTWSADDSGEIDIEVYLDI